MFALRTRNNKIRRAKVDIVIDIIIYFILGSAFLAVAYPLWFVVIASISDPTAVLTGQVIFHPVNISFEGYRIIFDNSAIWRGYANTVFYTLVGTLINIFFTVTIAFPLSKKSFSGRKVIMTFLLITMYFGGGLIPTFMLMSNLGLVNTRTVMVLMGAVSVFNVIITRVFFESTLSGELEEAAAIDGCSPIIFFITCVLPLSKAILAVLAIFYGVGHWNDFMRALIYLRDPSMYPLALILRSILIMQDVGAAVTEDVVDHIARMRLAELVRFGVIIVSSLPMLVIFPFMQRYFNKGVMIGSVKG